MADQIYKVRDPEGNIREISGPAGASDNDVIAKAKELFAKIPDKSKVDQIPGMRPQQPAPQQDRVFTNPFMRALSDVGSAVIETPVTLATGALGGLVGQVAGVGASLLSPELGTQKGVQIGQQTAKKIAEMLTYQPRGQGAKDVLETAEPVLQNLSAIPIPTLQAAGATAKPMAQALMTYGQAGAQQVAKTPALIAETLRNRQAPTMSGIGAASVSDANLRMARALELPAPIKLTKGQAEKTFEQQRFERETAKNPELGGQLRQRAIEQNDQILKNFDIFGEQTGSEQFGNLRAIGEIVDKVIVDKSNKAKADIKTAYDNARASGEMRELIPYKQISDYIDSHNPTVRTRLAPVINSVKQDLKMNDPDGTGLISINALEDIRQNLGKQIQPGTPNMPYGIEIKKLIDATTENTGGDVYQAARALRTNYSNEFKNVGIINKLLSTKPGGKDRAIALEDVFNDSILKGSLDDVQNVSKTLQTAGDSGKQAWQELQGQFVKNIKDEVTKSVVTNTAGKPIVSPAALDRLVKNLDSDGKLDFMLGKKVAQSIRTLNETTKNALVSVPEAVNYSNTASVVLAALDTILSASTGLPAPVLTGGRYLTKKIKERQTGKKIAEALSYGEQEQ